MSKKPEENENGLFQKLSTELIMYTAVYLNLAEIVTFQQVCHEAKNLNLSEALNNITSKPFGFRTEDPMQFLVWRNLLGRLALNMQIRDVLPDYKLEQKIAVIHFEPQSFKISPEIFNEISVNFFNSVKPMLEEKRKSADKKSCLMM